MSFKDRFFIVLVLFLVISIAPAGAIQISQTTHNNTNKEFTGLKTEISKIQDLKNSLDSDMTELKNQGNKIKYEWYKPWKWNECRSNLFSICGLIGHISVSIGELKSSADTVKGTAEIVKEESKVSLNKVQKDLNSILNSSSEDDANFMVQALKKDLNIEFTPVKVTVNDLCEGDVVQYKSQNKYYRYLRVSKSLQGGENVILESSNGKKIEPKPSQIEYIKIKPVFNADGLTVVRSAAQIQKNKLDQLQQKTNALKDLKEYTTRAYVLFYLGLGITGIGVALGIAGIWLFPLLLPAAIAVAIGGVLLGTSYTLDMKIYVNEALEVEKGIRAAQNNLNYYSNPDSHMFMAHDTNLTVTMNQNLTGTLNVTNTNGDERVRLVLAPEHGKINFNGLDFIYTPMDGFEGNDTFQYRVLDGKGCISNVAEVKIQVMGSPIPVVQDIYQVVFKERMHTGFIKVPDVNNTDLTLVIENMPRHGKLDVEPGLRFSYTPLKQFTGEDKFSYRVKTKEGKISNIAWVTLNVRPMPI